MQPYITKAEVHAAADIVDAKGKKPSPDNVHAEIGHGSNSTIAIHLKTWEARDQRLALPPLPETVTTAVNALTGDVWFIALREASEQYQVVLKKEAEAKAEAQANATEAGLENDRLSLENKSLRAAAAKTEKHLKERDRQLAESKELIGQLETEIAKKAAQVETLQRLLSDFSPSKTQTTMKFDENA
jgi:Plasmid replication region DNA-binding N-term